MGATKFNKFKYLILDNSYIAFVIDCTKSAKVIIAWNQHIIARNQSTAFHIPLQAHSKTYCIPNLHVRLLNCPLCNPFESISANCSPVGTGGMHINPSNFSFSKMSIKFHVFSPIILDWVLSYVYCIFIVTVKLPRHWTWEFEISE